MAYPSVAGPYGFLPINLIGGQVFAGSTRNMEIAPLRHKEVRVSVLMFFKCFRLRIS